MGRHSAGRCHTSVAVNLSGRWFQFFSHQCWIPVLEGILPEEQNDILLDLAFDMATWHAYAKLRMHTTHTIKSLRSQTKELGSQLRRYANKVCPKHKTKPLPGEAAATYRRQAAAGKKAGASNIKANAPSVPDSFKKFNLKTYKIHALGDYADNIERFGPTDCFSTQQVRHAPSQSSPPPHRYLLNRASSSTGESRDSTSEPTSTGGKGWCTEPVHHKYIARKWTMYPAFTCSVHLKYIQNFPSQFPHSFPSPGNDQYTHSVPGHVTAMFPLGN